MQTITKKLANGLQVILVDTNSFPTLTALVMVGAGSRYENPQNNGIAHFFEHMAFKGSKQFPNAYAISSTVENIGGSFNAFTSKDHTGYWIKATNDHTKTLIDVLSDMILHSLLDPNEIEREKGVIVEEINMYEDMPARKVGDIFEEVVYKGNPLSYDIAGTKETVTRFNRKTFTDYMSELYVPGNATVVLAGGLEGKGDEYMEYIEEKFGTWKNHTASTPVPFTPTQTKPLLYVRNKKTEQVHLSLGYRAFSFLDERKYALQVLATLLGGGMSSRLFMQVRERRGLCYYISSGREMYADTGMLTTQAGIQNDKKKIQDAINVIIDEHDKIARGEITEADVKNAQELVKGRYLLSLEDSMNIATAFGTKYVLEKAIVDPQNVIQKLMSVQKQDVLDVAKLVINKKNLNVALIGAYDESDFSL
jgi:predicted Zn-dependent peptidase